MFMHRVSAGAAAFSRIALFNSMSQHMHSLAKHTKPVLSRPQMGRRLGAFGSSSLLTAPANVSVRLAAGQASQLKTVGAIQAPSARRMLSSLVQRFRGFRRGMATASAHSKVLPPGFKPLPNSSAFRAWMTKAIEVKFGKTQFSFTVSDVFGHSAFVLLAISFLLSDILWLRSLALTAAVSSMTFTFWHPHGRPLWLPFRWNALFVIINGVQIIKLFNDEHQTRKLSKEEKTLYYNVFLPFNLSKTDFVKLLKKGRWEDTPADTHVTSAGTPNNLVRLVTSGSADVMVDGKVVYTLSAGQFIGEMGLHVGLRIGGYLPSIATVVTREPMRCLTWTRGRLIDLLENNPDIGAAVQSTISADLVRKALRNKRTFLQATPNPNGDQSSVTVHSIDPMHEDTESVATGGRDEVGVETHEHEQDTSSANPQEQTVEQGPGIVQSSRAPPPSRPYDVMPREFYEAQERADDDEDMDISRQRLSRTMHHDRAVTRVQGQVLLKLESARKKLFTQAPTPAPVAAPAPTPTPTEAAEPAGTTTLSSKDLPTGPKPAAKMFNTEQGAQPQPLSAWEEEQVVDSAAEAVTRVGVEISPWHNKDLREYETLLQAVLTDGRISQHERAMLRRFRNIHGITRCTHIHLLEELGWTATQYLAGSNSKVAEQTALETQQLRRRVDDLERPHARAEMLDTVLEHQAMER